MVKNILLHYKEERDTIARNAGIIEVVIEDRSGIEEKSAEGDQVPAVTVPVAAAAAQSQTGNPKQKQPPQ